MPRVIFTENLKRHVECPPRVVNGVTVGEALQAVFADNARLRDYILDDQGRVRHHMLVVVNGVVISDRIGLSDAVNEHDEIYVLQALSGG